MADKSLEVKITADVTSLQAQSAVARAEVSSTGAAVKALATQFVGASDDMKASLVPALEQAAQKAVAAKVDLAALNVEMRATAHPEVTGFFNQMTVGMNETAEKIEGMTSQLGAFQRMTSSMMEFAAAGLGLEQVAEAVNRVAESGVQLLHLSQATGMTTEQLSGLKLVAQESGQSFETFQTSLLRLANNMEGAVRTPTGAAAEAFKALGISVTDSSGNLKPMSEMMDQVGQALGRYEDGTNKAAIEMSLFGMRGQELVPILAALQSDGGVQGATDKIQAMGGALSQVAAENDEAFSVAMADASASLHAVGSDIVQGVLPGLTALVSGFESGGSGADLMGIAVNSLETVLKGVVGTVSLVYESVSVMEDGFFAFGQEIGDVIRVVGAFKDAAEGNFKQAEAEVSTDVQLMAQNFHGAIAAMNKDADAFDATIAALSSTAGSVANVMQTLGDHQGAGDGPALPDAPTMDTGKADSAAKEAAKEQVQVAADAATARKAIAASEYDAQVSVWDSEVTTGKISKAQEVQDKIAAENQMYTAAVAEAQAEAQLSTLTVTEKAKALDDIQVMQAQHVATMAQLNAELTTAQVEAAKEAADKQKAAADATAAAWQQAFAPVSQAFSTSINGIIQGTSTLQAAEAKAAQSIALSFIDAEAKKLVMFAASEAQILAHAVATEMGMTAATIAGNATRVATQTTAAATGKAVDATVTAAAINNNAAHAATGAYAAVAGIPYVGPVLAPIAAATAYAGVMAFDVLSASGGMDIGPGVNPMTQLHENEMVLPSHIASPLRSMLAGGNTTNDNSRGSDTYHHTNNINASISGGAGGLTTDLIFKALNNGLRGGIPQKYPALARAMRRGN